MSDKFYEMIIEVMNDMQGDGLFNDSMEQYMDFDILTKEEIEWYFKSYVIDSAEIKSYVKTYNLEREFDKYKKEVLN